MLFEKTAALGAENVGHLYGGPTHFCWRRYSWLASLTLEIVNWSSGLAAAWRCFCDRSFKSATGIPGSGASLI